LAAIFVDNNNNSNNKKIASCKKTNSPSLPSRRRETLWKKGRLRFAKWNQCFGQLWVRFASDSDNKWESRTSKTSFEHSDDKFVPTWQVRTYLLLAPASLAKVFGFCRNLRRPVNLSPTKWECNFADCDSRQKNLSVKPKL
jgi:hypothetical protein